jgi:hypothetical protein
MKNAGLARRSDNNVVTTKHRLLTHAWTVEVQNLESAIGHFNVTRTLRNPCQVAFFEVAGDDELHVNITHRHQTAEVRGWAGPANMPEGYVHNRRFGDTRPAIMIRQIRQMVFAARP